MSKSMKRALLQKLIIFLPVLLLQQFAKNAYTEVELRVYPPAQRSVLLEVTYTCKGMCGDTRVWSFRLLGNGVTEYQELRTITSNPNKSDMILKKEALLGKETFDELINLAERPEFLDSPQNYDSNLKSDMVWILDVTYRNKDKLKQIHLRNYYPGAVEASKDPPEAVRQIIEQSGELIMKMKKGQ